MYGGAKATLSVFSLLIAALAVFPASVMATTGTLTITVDTILTEDHFGNIIVTNGATLDCAGFSVIGPGNAGIQVDAGVTIKNCHVTGGFNFAFDVFGGSGSTLTDNTASGNEIGFDIVVSSGNTLTGNMATGNILGMRVAFSSGNTLSGNTMSGNLFNFHLQGNTDSHFDNSIDPSNTVDGKPIFLVRDATSQVFDASTNAGTFYCIRCDDVTIKDLTVTGNWIGVFLFKTENSRLENIAASDNFVGVTLRLSDNNVLVGNTATGGNVGLFFGSSSSNLALGNSVSVNRFGVILGGSSSSNTLTGNTVSSNMDGFRVVGGSAGNDLRGNSIIGNDHGIHVCRTLRHPMNSLFPNQFMGPQQAVFIDRLC